MFIYFNFSVGCSYLLAIFASTFFRTLHTGQRDFVCSQCGMAFNRKSKLDVHIASHLHTALPCQVLKI